MILTNCVILRRIDIDSKSLDKIPNNLSLEDVSSSTILQYCEKNDVVIFIDADNTTVRLLKSAY